MITRTVGTTAGLQAAKRYVYCDITAHCHEQIQLLMANTGRHQGLEQRYRIERAYGIYMGWRTLVMAYADPIKFARDDRRLEQMIAQIRQ